jgi:hypothetical protein
MLVHVATSIPTQDRKTYAKDTTVNITTEPVTPAKTTHQGGETDAHEQNRLEVVSVLPDDDRALVQVANVSSADFLGVLLEDHPSHV